MAEQLELCLAWQNRETARLNDAATLAGFLAGRGWMSAEDLAGSLRWKARRVRAAAAASKGAILGGPGMPGYKITREATPDERDAAIAAFRSQARRMIRRSLEISARHREGRATA